MTDAITAGQNQARRLLSSQSKRKQVLGPRLVEVILVIALGILLALAALRLFAPLPLPKGNVGAVALQSADSAQAIVVTNPFPVTTTAAVVIEEEALADVADTTLDLKLTGVWADDAIGSATIETPDRKQSRFAVGDQIIDGVRLESVFADHVIINRAGVRESLRFESKTAQEQRPQQAASPSLRTAPSSNVNAARSAGFTDILRLAPAIDENGDFAIDIYAARDRQTFNAYGFRDGDRVVSVNGTPPPANPAELRAIVGTLQRDSEAIIVVRRGDREIPVVLSLEGLGNR